ncbi:PREDICTED: parathyroid hormone/parathyroid hormone-related peptide receptor-like isoform X2 [Priapulus caudatus]|uniref:Parathyroid hormone/parathyroid hormone-related peptide receptor-like isoform X2 n=1 Tax=Priapulus caudatus TaxID=37621 RepID=A0ABM1DUI8_PRICU|nr:PREDICTED: parathyroid hormone/parathyroid hormone-related peptide receptor-like isoform X2 [Priapulus caudatus]
MSKQKQREILFHQSELCREMANNTTAPVELHCPLVFDSLVCWNYTQAGTTAIVPCPAYVVGFDSSGFATRTCEEDGTWYFNTNHNKTWSNYTDCMAKFNIEDSKEVRLILPYMPKLKLMECIGYGISLATLSIAVIILLAFKRLHCPRNSLHVHLFVSFILRASLSILKDTLFIDGLGLKMDVVFVADKPPVFRTDISHWQCKLLVTVWHYCLMANYFWILMEGLYLHSLILMNVFTERSGIRWYTILGWAGPLFSIVPWIIVKSQLASENLECWNINHNATFFWIIRGPITASILINFVFFLNIIRVLYTKLRDSNTANVRKYRKLAKSTLVLVPLFGAHYFIFIGMTSVKNEVLELTWLFFDLFFCAFQGLFVSLLFCFFNGEVRGEIKKRWLRYRLRRGFHDHGGSFGTALSYMGRASNRNSMTLSRCGSSSLNGIIPYNGAGGGGGQKNPRVRDSPKARREVAELVTVEATIDCSIDVSRPMITKGGDTVRPLQQPESCV